MNGWSLSRRCAIRVFVVAAATLGMVAALLATRTFSAHADAPDSCSAVAHTSQLGPWHKGTISSGSDVDWFRFRTAADRHALITLGGLSADLSLRVYSATCRLLGTSQHTGVRYEEIYRYLQAGRYYVRVAGVSGAAGPYALRFRSPPKRLIVLSSHSTRDADTINIAGEVLNNSPIENDFLDTGAIFYDAQNRVVTVSYGFTDMHVVAPFHRSPFELSAVVPASYDHYRVFVPPHSQGERVMHRLTFTDRSAVADGSGGRVYSGRIHNGNSFRVAEVVVAVAIRDGFGRVLSSQSTYLADIAPGGSRRFSIDMERPAGANATSYFVDAVRR